VPSFGITPVTGFPPVTDDGFPRFIQFRVDGNDVGGRSVENVNFVGDVSGTVSSDGSTATFDIGVPGINWTDVPGDYMLTDTDVDAGIAATGVSGAQVITIPGDDELDADVGRAVLIYADGGATVQIVPASGVTLRYRDAFIAEIAGQFGIVTLIKRAANEWLLCGDMAAA
jgi:hypothetical protein